MKLIMPSTGSRCHCSLPPGVGLLWPQVMWIRDNWISDRSYRHIQIGMQTGVAGMWECEIVRHGVTVQPRLLWALTEAAMNGARWDNYLMLRRLRHVADYFKLCIDNQHQSHGAASLNLVTKSQPPHKCWAFCVSYIHRPVIGQKRLKLELGLVISNKWKLPRVSNIMILTWDKDPRQNVGH